MKQKILELTASGPQGDGLGTFLLVGGIILAAAFFGFIFFDTYRIRKRARQMQGRIK